VFKSIRKNGRNKLKTYKKSKLQIGP